MNILKKSMTNKITLAISMLALGVASYALLHKPKTIASFDVTGTVKQFESQLAKDNFTEAQNKAQYARFNHAMSKAEEDYSEDNNVSLIVSQATVTNIKDVTQEIQLRIQQNMRK